MFTIAAAIFIISGSVLAYEVALMRIFSITQWHHLAYMVVSVALLGFGASGTFLSLFQKTVRKHARFFLLLFSLLFSASMVVCLWASQSIPFNLFLLLRDWHQFANLLLYYLAFFVPFFFAAAGIGITFLMFERNIPTLYGANLLGSGIGAIGVIGLLSFLDPVSAVRAVSLVSLAAPILVGIGSRRPRPAVSIVFCAIIAVGVILFPLRLSISEYKTLSVLRQTVGAKILETEHSPIGRLDVVDSPALKFDPAPGLSFAFQGEVPPVKGIVMDADAVTIMTGIGDDVENARYLDYTTQALPYHLIKRPKVAVLGAGGGSGVLLALLHDAEKVTAVELDPTIIRLVKDKYADFCGGIYSLPQVKTVAAEGRGLMEATKEKYDIIQLPLMGSFGASAAGVYALSENYLYTVQAFATYLNRLTDDGILSLTFWMQSPPRDNIKAFATARAGLWRAGWKRDTHQNLVFIRSWKTGTILVKRGPFTEDEIQTIRTFCDERSFDVAYYPSISREETNRFNILTDFERPGVPKPLYYEACKAIVDPEDPYRTYIYRDYLFDVRPSGDVCPYFFHFFKWKSLPVLWKMMGSQWLPWGYVLLIATLIQAVLASVILIVLPLIFLPKRKGAVRKARRLLYFLCLGLAFMFVEMSLMQKFVLFLRHPIYSIAVVISSFLIFSGVGSLLARKFMKRRLERRRGHRMPFYMIVVIALIYIVFLRHIFSSLSSLPTAGRIVASMVFLAPLAFFMGMPFPLGLQNVSDTSPSLVPWCWGVNGCASVLSTVLATTLAMSFGFGTVILLAALLYLIAGWIGT